MPLKSRQIDYLLLIGILAFMISFIAIMNYLKKPKEIIIEPQPMTEVSSEEGLLKKALLDPEAVLYQSDQDLPLIPNIEAGSSDKNAHTRNAPTNQEALHTYAKKSHPESAPEINEDDLSPALRRSLHASQSLRTKDFIEPESQFNQTTVQTLRDIRRTRHSPILPELLNPKP